MLNIFARPERSCLGIPSRSDSNGLISSPEECSGRTQQPGNTGTSMTGLLSEYSPCKRTDRRSSSWERRVVAIDRDGRIEYVIVAIPADRDTRFKDVSADPSGRIFWGTMSAQDHPCIVYRNDVHGSITPVVEYVGISKGMGSLPAIGDGCAPPTPLRTGPTYSTTTSRQAKSPLGGPSSNLSPTAAFPAE